MTDGLDGRAGLAIGLVMFGVLIIMGAVMLMVFGQIIPDLHTNALAQTDTNAASEGIGYMQDVWAAMPFIILALGAVMLYARSSREPRFGGRR